MILVAKNTCEEQLMNRAIPSSETDSEFLTRSRQRMETPSSLGAVDMPPLPTPAGARQSPGKRRTTARKRRCISSEEFETAAARWKQAGGKLC